ncbi:MAG: class II fructose-bisphosphate aldolase [Clostridiales bacterium]|jgi:ketose-bisphosphate aldolase|nr:class II fructose-bisphosphate aldolase [Clostridiales bacterium]
MPLERVSNILKEADKGGYAVAAFNVFNYETIAWIVEAAEEEDMPVIAMLYPACSKFIPYTTFVAIVKDVASKAKVPVGLHLDHSRSYEEIMAAIRDGFTSVMIDGSTLPFEDNVKITKEIVKVAHAMDVDVEAELGYVGRASNLDDYTDKSRFTDSDSVVEFVERTGVDSLAIAIGNAHGNYVATPNLDLERLEDINSRTDVPLVLHGGSGIPDEQIRAAVKLGINKINIGTELNQLFMQQFQEIMNEGKAWGMLGCMMGMKDKVIEGIRQKIRLLKP